MKELVRNTVEWIDTHAAKTIPVSVKYIRLAVMNQAAFTRAIQGIEVDERELFNDVVHELAELGREIKGLTHEEEVEIFQGLETVDGVKTFEADVISQDPDFSLRDNSKTTTSDYNDCVIKLSDQMKLSDLMELELWSWLWEVVQIAESRDKSVVVFSAKYLN